MLDELPPAERAIFVDALVTYADACTRPSLTPSCPFFRTGPEGPTCEEECRGIAEACGDGSRPVKTFLVEGGLVLTGRQIPRSSASGVLDFDAGRSYLLERSLPFVEQSTSALLVGLASALRPPLFAPSADGETRAARIWQELEARGVPVDSVVRGAIVPQMAIDIAMSVLLVHVVQSGNLPAAASVDLARKLAKPRAGSWQTLLQALVDKFENEDAAKEAAYRSRYSPYQGPCPGGVGPAVPSMDAPEQYEIEVDSHLALALSGEFLGRVEEWLARLMSDDRSAALRATPPPPSVFLTFDASRIIRDEVGLWIWERLAVTDMADWSDSSLLLEWRCHRGDLREVCPQRVLAERSTPHEAVAELALERASRSHGRRTAKRGLHPSFFVRKAVEHLESGRPEAAASIFRGLVDIRPADGESWNNLGFCEMPIDLEAAFDALERASLYPIDSVLLNVVNRCLVLHLLRRDQEAIALAESSRFLRDPGLPPAFLWEHHSLDGALVLNGKSDPTRYFDELLEHIVRGSCGGA